MNKIVFGASIALVAVLAACSADTTSPEGTEPTTESNGTSPAVDDAKLPGATKTVQRSDVAAAHELATVGDRREGLRGVRQLTAPSPELQAPATTPIREPINQ